MVAVELSITHDRAQGSAPGQHRVTIEATIGGEPLRAVAKFAFAWEPQDPKNLRRYLENPPKRETDLTKEAAERRIEKIGRDLFKKIFDLTDGTRALWARVKPHLADTRIKITAGIAEESSIPWELIREPGRNPPLACAAKAFVRGRKGGALAAYPRKAAAGKVRILLVICRPDGDADVPFRVVGDSLLRGIDRNGWSAFELDVLRPPSYAALEKKLRDAKDSGRPFHLLHFDGHGTYDIRSKQGFLVFEGPEHSRTVSGGEIGALMKETDVPVLVLNACRSAYAETQPQPLPSETGRVAEELREYGTLAQEVVEAGVMGVVAMRYSIRATTAEPFIGELYSALTNGLTLGEAVSRARGHLHANPGRRHANQFWTVQNWCVPVVYEQNPIALWPRRPDIAFIGQNGVFWTINHAFNRKPIALLHGCAGAGKTAAARKFAEWYMRTGGADDVMFSSFEHHLSLAGLIDEAFRPVPQPDDGKGVVTPGRRRARALQILNERRVLWIWDNVAPVAGFPTGTKPAWSDDKQRELTDFLAELHHTKAKILLTSRRCEAGGWLGTALTRIPMPMMPGPERWELARAVAERQGKECPSDLDDLLDFTQGNPQTILTTVGDVLKKGLTGKSALGNYVAALRAGVGDFGDEETDDRRRSLRASLDYGFKHTFDESEQKILAVLHLFQGFVDANALCLMGNPKYDYGCNYYVPALQEVTREKIISLLDRTADTGLLTAISNGHYAIHPAVPWYFRTLYTECYPAAEESAESPARAFAEAMGTLGNMYGNQYCKGQRALLDLMDREEGNLLAAWQMALRNKWWDCVVRSMQGLRNLYIDTPRGDAWPKLVENALPHFIDQETDLPLPGRDKQWGMVTDYRISLAEEKEDREEAKRLLKLCCEWNKRRAGEEEATAEKPYFNHNLIVAMQKLGRMLCEDRDNACVECLGEAFDLARCTENRAIEEIVTLERIIASNLGDAFKDIDGIRDLVQAKRWYEHSRKITNETDGLSLGEIYIRFGALDSAEYDKVKMARRPESELKFYFDAAKKTLIDKALHHLPETARTDRAICHYTLGNLFDKVDQTDIALNHYIKAIDYIRDTGDLFLAGKFSYHAATTLRRAKRPRDALSYAGNALEYFSTSGRRADPDGFERKNKDLIIEIKGVLRRQRGSPS